MEWYEADVAALTERLATHRVAEPAVFYGSSSIRLWDTLAADLGDPRAVNAGFGGSTLEACSYFFERIVPPVDPASLVVYAGDNDLGDGRSPDDVLESYQGLAAQVERRCGTIPFGFLSIKPSLARAGILERIRQANALIRNDLERRPGTFYVDLFDAMLSGGEPDPACYLPDGLHLSRAGYERWVHALAPFRARIFPMAP